MAANAAYHNDVAGIGRDDGATLDQKQSHEHHPGRQRIWSRWASTRSTPTIRPIRARSATICSFLMWGDNSLSAAFDVLHRVAVARAAANRRHGADLEGAGDRRRRHGHPGIPLTVDAGQPVYLVMSNDEVFDATDHWLQLSLETAGSQTYQSATLDFINGQFFTFATFTPRPAACPGSLQLWLKANAGVTSTPTEAAAGRTSPARVTMLGQRRRRRRRCPRRPAGVLNFNPSILSMPRPRTWNGSARASSRPTRIPASVFAARANSNLTPSGGTSPISASTIRTWPASANSMLGCTMQRLVRRSSCRIRWRCRTTSPRCRGTTGTAARTRAPNCGRTRTRSSTRRWTSRSSATAGPWHGYVRPSAAIKPSGVARPWISGSRCYNRNLTARREIESRELSRDQVAA